MSEASLVLALAAMGVGLSMVWAGVGQGLLAWRRNQTDGKGGSDDSNSF
jgi:hypothetical protein